jgi:hypothetical protein
MKAFTWTQLNTSSEFFVGPDGKLRDKEYDYSESLFKRIKRVKREKLKLFPDVFLNEDSEGFPIALLERTPTETLANVQKHLDEKNSGVSQSTIT